MIIIMMIIKRYSSFTSLDNLIKEKSRFSRFYNLSSAACLKFKTSEGVVKVQAGVCLIKMSTTHLINTALALNHQ